MAHLLVMRGQRPPQLAAGFRTVPLERVSDTSVVILLYTELPSYSIRRTRVPRRV